MGSSPSWAFNQFFQKSTSKGKNEKQMPTHLELETKNSFDIAVVVLPCAFNACIIEQNNHELADELLL